MRAHILGTGNPESIRYAEAAFAFFISAGYFKVHAYEAALYADITFLSGILVFLLTAISWVKNRIRVGRSLALVAAFYLAFVPAIAYQEWHPYAIDKTFRFFTLTLLTLIAPLFLIRSVVSLRRFVSALAIIGGAIMINVLYHLVIGDYGNRASGFYATTIASGRMIGLTMIYLLITMWLKVLPRWLCVPLLSIGGYELVATGARGPLIGLCLIILLSLALTERRSKIARVALLSLVIASAVLITSYYRSSLPAWSAERVGSLAGLDFGTSGQVRGDFIDLSWAAIQSNPLGIGLGGFMLLVPRAQGREFPHNIVLETAVEGGWVAATIFLIILCTAFRGLHGLVSTRTGQWVPLIALLMMSFLFINDLVSGELNDSRNLFAFVAIGLAAPVYWRKKAVAWGRKAVAGKNIWVSTQDK